MRIGRLISTAMAAGAAALIFAAPALADSTISINPGNVPTTAQGFNTHTCDPNQGGGPFPGMDVWVFVLPGNHDTSGDFKSLTAVFADGSVSINTTDNPGNFSNGGPSTSKAWIITTAGRTLTGGSAVITGTADFFNLTHTCPASGSPSPSPSMSKSPSPTPSASKSASPSPSASMSKSASPSPSMSKSASPSASMSSKPSSETPKPSGGAETGGGGSYGVTGIGLGALALAAAGGIGLVFLRRRMDDRA